MPAHPKTLQKTIDQKKRAVITRPFGREASIVPEMQPENVRELAVYSL
jgi:hypothetical protein